MGQMAGRALRLFEGKKDAFILDFGENCQRLKLSTAKHKTPLCAIKEPEEGEAPMKICPVCQNVVPNFAKICPYCGHVFEKEPEQESGEEAVFGEILSVEEKEEVSHCISIGFIYRQTKDYVWIFSSYEIDNLGEITYGDRTVIPANNIKSMEKLNGKKTKE